TPLCLSPHFPRKWGEPEGGEGSEQIVNKRFTLEFIAAQCEQLFELIKDEQSMSSGFLPCNEKSQAARFLQEIVHQRGSRGHGFGITRQFHSQRFERMRGGVSA